MKKLVFLFISAFLSLGVMAQTAVEKNQADLNKDVKKVRTERKQRNHSIKHGHFKSASAKQKEINMDRKDMNADKKELKIEGVKNPVDKAKDKVPPQK